MVFAIIAFSVIAEGAGYSRVNFAIWCGVTTMVFALLFMLCYLGDVPQARGTIPLVIDAIWWVFWLSCAGALSADLNNYGRALDGSSKSRMQAAVAFSWLTWFLYWADLYFDYEDARGGGRTITLPATVTQPNSAYTSSGAYSGGGVQMSSSQPGTVSI
ncbi:non-classical export Nce102 [Chlorella sorokiniana]|uniref:Non-classical export Nce102 n=1 Tax=Chlorella sorokiniana TaxID=3076 RepID=A0A2P6U1R5_CHLSO|nr:non-classical export Nce102 [Chlorella sorokiniana]|eukprot:PRW60251.1 non-classical export Nce102 [Chlorella sorokiniana]